MCFDGLFFYEFILCKSIAMVSTQILLFQIRFVIIYQTFWAKKRGEGGGLVLILSLLLLKKGTKASWLSPHLNSKQTYTWMRKCSYKPVHHQGKIAKALKISPRQLRPRKVVIHKCKFWSNHRKECPIREQNTLFSMA